MNLLPLPLAPERIVPQAGTGKTGKRSPCQARVLLVEDHEPNILVVTTYLEMMGLDFDIARNGLEAQKKIAKGSYAVVLMDIQMPVMDGLVSTCQIRARERKERLPRLPIIGMTAFMVGGDRQRCLNVGMDEYISKPIDLKELESKVLAILDSPPDGVHPSGGNR